MSTVIRKSDTSLEKKTATLLAIGWQVGIRSYAWSPPTDVYDTEIGFVVRVEVAGMRESDFTIEVDGRTLAISGMRVDSQERRAYHQMEIRFGEFSTSVDLPPGVDTQHAEADYEDGFLTIIFPKIKPTGIPIQG
ncbi:MAG: Hsp20/alpha crystallin family protein [Chloroflexota bacterium]